MDCGQPGGGYFIIYYFVVTFFLNQIQLFFYILYFDNKGWKECSNNKQCAEGCVKRYLNRYASFCSLGNSCAALGRIHNGGPYGCGNNNTEYYGWLIARCLRREAPYEKIDTFQIPN